jgi:hypothetical protein
LVQINVGSCIDKQIHAHIVSSFTNLLNFAGKQFRRTFAIFDIDTNSSCFDYRLQVLGHLFRIIRVSGFDVHGEWYVNGASNGFNYRCQLLRWKDIAVRISKRPPYPSARCSYCFRTCIFE